MHPLNKLNFGVTGLAVQYYNGTAVVPGYILRQIGTTRYMVTDGTNPATVTLAPTTAIATALSTAGNQSYCTMLLQQPAASASGATFTVTYGIDSVAVTAGGTSYAVSNVLTLTGLGGGTVTVSTVSSGVVTGVTVSNVGSVTSLPTNPVAVTGGAGTGATFTLKYKVLSIASSGGTGYAVNEPLNFTGIVATTKPTAHIATSVGGAASTVTVDTAGAGITTAGTLGARSGADQHVSILRDNLAVTTEGSMMPWSLGTSQNGRAYITTYS